MEYDGVWHASADQPNWDRRRLNQLVALGWIVLHVTGERMRRELSGIIREAIDAFAIRGVRLGSSLG